MRRVVIAWVLATVTVSHLSSAQSATDKAAAQALFDAGKRLMDESKYGESCPKFAESQRLDPAPGTLLNLADCYEKSGMTASAWATWLEAAASARTAGQTERENAARARAAALKPRLVSINISVPEASRVPGLTVQRDGVAIGIAVWGTAVPVDPGSHAIVATAPGRRNWETTVTVVDGVQPVQVIVPHLEPDATPAPTSSAAESPAVAPATSVSPNAPLQTAPPAGAQPVAPTPNAGSTNDTAPAGSSQKTWAYVAGGVGVASLAVGTVFGLRAKSKNEDSKDLCRTETICGKEGYDLRQDALSAASYSSVAFGIGAAGLITGVILFVTAPGAAEKPAQARAKLSLDAKLWASSGGVTLKGAF